MFKPVAQKERDGEGGGGVWPLDTLMWKGGSGLEGLSRLSQPFLLWLLHKTVCVRVCVGMHARAWPRQGGRRLSQIDSKCEI